MECTWVKTKFKAIWLLCNVQDACMGHICENGGTCDIKNGDVTCVCTPFYGGERCEKKGTIETSFIFTNIDNHLNTK